MKKVKKVLLTALVLLPFSATVLFTGCSNFLNGSSLKTNLEEEIKRNTASNADVTVRKSNVDDTGMLEPSGTVSGVKVGYPIELSYEPSSAYYFVKWNAVNSDGNPLDETNVLFDDEYNPVTTVTINTTEKVIIQAVSSPKEKLTISFDAGIGSSVPVDTKSYYEDTEFSLTWKSNTNYAFLGWEVYDSSINKKLNSSEYNEYLKFEDITSDSTTVTVLKTGKSLVFKALSVERPQVVSGTPYYDSDGVYRDRRINIMFNQSLDEDSIYFTESELPEDETLVKLTTVVNEENKIYGYYLNNNLNTTVYKCVSIVKLNDKSKNLLMYYLAPEFDPLNKGILRISANPDRMPPASTDILVTVKTAFGLKCTDSTGKAVEIGIPVDYPWNFYTNAKSDNIPPSFGDVQIFIPKGSDQKTYSELNANKQTLLTSDPVDTDIDKIPTFNANQSKLWIQAQIYDGGSGPSALSANVYKVNNSKFYPCEETGEPVLTYDANLSTSGSNAYVCNYYEEGNALNTDGEYFDISELKETSGQGLYKIEFTASDKNGLTAKCNDAYYFIYDVQEPAPVIEAYGFYYKKGKVMINFALKNSVYESKLHVKYKKTDDENADFVSCDFEPGDYVCFNNGKNYSVEVPLYRNGKQYTFELGITDKWGNTSEENGFIGNTENYIADDGNFIYKNKKIKYTALTPVIEKPTKYSVYDENSTSLGLRNADGDVSKTIVPADVLKAPDGGLSARYAGAFDCKRDSGIVNGENPYIELQPYAIGKYECINALVNPIFSSQESESYASKTSLNFYQIIQFCNALSILYGFEPCYMLYEDSSCSVEKDVDDWSYNFSWNNMNTGTFDNTLKCDFKKNGYRLPYDLEWENASRGGVQDRFENGVYQWFEVHCGSKSSNAHDAYWPDTEGTYSSEASEDYWPRHNFNIRGLAAFANYNNNLGGITEVGRLLPNWIGTYDMGGNAHEFVWDACNGSTVSTATIYGYGPEANGVSGPVSTSNCRIIRGGYYGDADDVSNGHVNLRNYHRHGVGATSGNPIIGWRLARTLGND